MNCLHSWPNVRTGIFQTLMPNHLDLTWIIIWRRLNLQEKLKERRLTEADKKLKLQSHYKIESECIKPIPIPRTTLTLLSLERAPPSSKSAIVWDSSANRTWRFNHLNFLFCSLSFSSLTRGFIVGFGEVRLVRMQGTQLYYAMKRISKEHIVQKDQVKHIKAERALMVR